MAQGLDLAGFGVGLVVLADALFLALFGAGGGLGLLPVAPVVAQGLDLAGFGVGLVVLADALFLALFGAGGGLGLLPVAPVVAQLVDGLLLAAQLGLAGGAVHDQIVAAVLFTGGGDLVLLHRFACGMGLLVDGLGRAAELGLADGAVHHGVIAARLFAGGRDLVLHHRLRGRVGQLFDGLAGLDLRLAVQAVRVAGVALGGAGGVLRVAQLGLADVVVRVDVDRFGLRLAAVGAGEQLFTL